MKLSKQAMPKAVPLVRPYAGTIRYSGGFQRAREGPHTRSGLGRRALNPHVFYQLPMLVLIKLLEMVGILGPRGCCPQCCSMPGDGDLRVRQNMRQYTLGALTLDVQNPLLTWRCSGDKGSVCPTAVPVLRSCEVANPSWTLQQNAALLWHWAQMQEPSGDELAGVAFVDNGSVPGWQGKLRDLVAEERQIVEDWIQLGGVGVDVEMDEVSFRWRKVTRSREEGGDYSLVERYVVVAERVGRRMLCIPLPTKKVVQGGRCGAITNEELYAAIFPRGRPPILLPGTVVHTDSAKAYRNLGWQGAPATERLPQELAQELLGERPCPWRLEAQEEADEREEAERAEELGTLAGRTEWWASRYRHLRLVHTAVVHKKKPGKRRQYVMMRRCHFMPEDAEVLRARGHEPFLVGNVTWRKGGTQKVDGYWRTLRRRTANRGANSRIGDLMRRKVLAHQWSHALGPAADLFQSLGDTFTARRARTPLDMEVARRAWEEAGEQEVDRVVPEHIHAGDRVWVEQAWRMEKVVCRGTKRAREAGEGKAKARVREAKAARAHGSFAAQAAQKRVGLARAKAAAAVARAEAAAQAREERARGQVADSLERAEAAEAAAWAAAPPAPGVGDRSGLEGGQGTGSESGGGCQRDQARARDQAGPRDQAGEGSRRPPSGRGGGQGSDSESEPVGPRSQSTGLAARARDRTATAAVGSVAIARAERGTAAGASGGLRRLRPVAVRQEIGSGRMHHKNMMNLFADEAALRREALELQHPGTAEHTRLK